jgi:mannosylglucosylglycerate synthase
MASTRKIGFISTRFAGTDGVSQESQKWADVLADFGHDIFWYAGMLDRPEDCSYCVPEAHFQHPENLWLEARIWGRRDRSPLVSRRIRDMAYYLKSTIYEFVDKFDIDILVIQNALSIPMHIPLGVGITEFLAETNINAIAHHHDFPWERTRFAVNAVSDYLSFAFPPRHPRLQHAVINLAAQEELSWRMGVTSLLVPNVLDFKTPPPGIDDYNQDVRAAIGLEQDDIMMLQPTRVVPRKGIEHSIKLVELLENPRVKLVVSHESGDEGTEYLQMLRELAHESNVDIRFIEARIGEERRIGESGEKIYSLWDLYAHADFVTYPSLYEGFGNAFLEAVYFRLPIMINRYAIYTRDIEPKGFQVPVMDNFVTRRLAREVQRLLDDQDYRRKTCDKNYNIASHFYSFDVLRRSVRTLITNITGLE